MTEKIGYVNNGGIDSKILVPADLSPETRGTLFPEAASDGAYETVLGRSGAEKDHYWNTTTKVLRYHNGTSWDAYGGGGGGATLTVENFTADDTLTEGESGKVCTDYGAVGKVLLTLPHGAATNTYFGFVSVTPDQDFEIRAQKLENILHNRGTDDDRSRTFAVLAASQSETETVEVIKIATGVWMVRAPSSVWDKTVYDTRAYFCGGNTGSETNAIYGGDTEAPDTYASRGSLTEAKDRTCGVYGEVLANICGASNSDTAEIEHFDMFVTITVSVSDRANLSVKRKSAAGVSTAAYGFIGGGENAAGSEVNVIDYLDNTTSSGGASNKGDLTVTRKDLASCFDQGSYGYFGGGWIAGPTNYNTIDYIQMVTGAADASDRGDLVQTRSALAGLQGADYGYFVGGTDQTASLYDNIEYISFVTQIGNASDRGDRSTATAWASGASGRVQGLLSGGFDGFSAKNFMESMDLTATTGNTNVEDNISVATYGQGAAGGGGIS